MATTSNDLWETLKRIGDGMEARQKREQVEKEAAKAEAARKAPRAITSYLTVSGSDLGRQELAVEIAYATLNGMLTATCAGCGETEGTSTHGLFSDTPEEEQARIDKELPTARRWAQSHAEKCRAMPKPTTS